MKKKVTLFYAEVSNGTMHSRVILKNIGLRYTKLYEVLEILYMSTYVIARGVGLPFHCMVITFTASNVSLYEKVLLTALFL